ncbi:hypothetical protein GY45DRAFT_862615 [Cubamyces sp. BRFM 1775]|nr:hypothetical protein GY45DRAFT_862615 [Cubamyces sp. BRFM 1775]
MMLLGRLSSHLALRVIILLPLSGLLSSGAVSAASVPTAIPHLRAPRQDLTTSTSIDWWPYPSWGAQTSTLLPTVVNPTPTQDPLDSSTTVEVTSTFLDDTISTTTAPDPSQTQSDPSSMPTTSSSSGTIIHITALPPARSSSVSRDRSSSKKGSNGGFDIVYLAPLFAILGVLAGMLCTWLAYRYIEHRGGAGLRRREQSLEPGPRYTPPSRFRQSAGMASLAPPEEDLARPSQSSSRPLLDVSTDPEGRQGNWIARAFSHRSRTAHSPVENVAPEVADDAPAEDDPFLDRPSATTSPIPSTGLGRQGTTRTTFSQQLTSPDPYGALSDEEDAAPYETLRHKSIRRGILERLRLGTLRRPLAAYEPGRTEEEDVACANDSPVRRPSGTRRGHKRDSSDVTVHAMRSPMRTLSTEDTPSRRPSTLSRNPSELVKSPPGFRLVVEDPESGDLMSAPPSRSASPTKSPTKEGASGWGWNLSWSASRSPSKKSGGDDKFTALPVRRSLADKRISPCSSPSASRIAVSVTTTEESDAGGLAPLSRIDSSILPASPPMVTSPPLESQLFFGAVSPDFGSNPSLHLRLPEPAQNKHARVAAAAHADDTTSPGDKHKKLKTHRSPPLLPFPSTASSSPFRGRLKKTPTKKSSAATASPPSSARARPGPDRNVSADSVDSVYKEKSRGTPAQRHEARHSALSKVDEILSRSWSDRQLVRDSFPGSPTNFGAYLPAAAARPSLEKLVDEEALNGVGIEQRLEALRANA